MIIYVVASIQMALTKVISVLSEDELISFLSEKLSCTIMGVSVAFNQVAISL